MEKSTRVIIGVVALVVFVIIIAVLSYDSSPINGSIVRNVLTDNPSEDLTTLPSEIPKQKTVGIFTKMYNAFFNLFSFRRPVPGTQTTLSTSKRTITTRTSASIIPSTTTYLGDESCPGKIGKYRCLTDSADETHRDRIQKCTQGYNTDPDSIGYTGPIWETQLSGRDVKCPSIYIPHCGTDLEVVNSEPSCYCVLGEFRCGNDNGEDKQNVYRCDIDGDKGYGYIFHQTCANGCEEFYYTNSNYINAKCK